MILLLSTSDTDLLSARAAAAKEADVEYRWANPARLLDDDLPGLLDGADIAVIRLLGGRRAWEEGIDAVIASGIPTVLVSGEQAPDAELTEYSTVPANVATTAHAYLAEGGPDNLAQLHNFLSDTLLFTGLGFAEPKRLPAWGHLERNWDSAVDEQSDDRTGEKTGGDIEAAASADATGTAPVIAVIYYRAQHLAGNTAYVSALCSAIEKRGAVAKPIYAASLRTAGDDLIAELGTCDALITTVLAAGGNRPALAQAGGDDGTWDVAALAKLDMPIIQGLALTSPRQAWEDNDEGLTPLDVATQIAVPEFDGRLSSVPFSFKEIDSDDLITYVPDFERCDRLAGIAVRTRTLHEETRRVFRARVVNPRWMSAMRAHGYKGAFEMAATVDYLFGYDATTGVMDDWMYETLTDEYVASPENREFFDKSNPWALHDISERLLEAADRKMWESPDEERLELLRRTFLESEGELEGR